MPALNTTHDPQLTSWVASANRPDGDFPVQNLPFGVFRRAAGSEPYRGAVAIGDELLDLGAVRERGVFDGLAGEAVAACDAGALNAFMGQGPVAWSALRAALSQALRTGSAAAGTLGNCLLPQAAAEFRVPARIGDFTDFYTSIHHATNVGRLFRPDNPLLPNYKWVPIGYHGRCSSIGVSGQGFRRPLGQTRAADAEAPVLGPARRLDYELELGVFVGPGNDPGERVAIDAADGHVFGLCLLNDWSARDIQAWEYQPLGPFLSKSFASTVSPWVVTLEALAPYRAPWTRPADDPQPLAYLDSPANRDSGAFDIRLEVLLETARMRAEGNAPSRVAATSFRHSYWTVAQMLAHHTVNGCNLQPGDLFGSGTQSGPSPEEVGSLLERTNGGKQPLTLANGETRTFVEDGDAVIMRGWCEKPGAARIGFGEVRAEILPALA